MDTSAFKYDYSKLQVVDQVALYQAVQSYMFQSCWPAFPMQGPLPGCGYFPPGFNGQTNRSSHNPWFTDGPKLASASPADTTASSDLLLPKLNTVITPETSSNGQDVGMLLSTANNCDSDLGCDDFLENIFKNDEEPCDMSSAMSEGASMSTALANATSHSNNNVSCDLAASPAQPESSKGSAPCTSSDGMSPESNLKASTLATAGSVALSTDDVTAAVGAADLDFDMYLDQNVLTLNTAGGGDFARSSRDSQFTTATVAELPLETPLATPTSMFSSALPNPFTPSPVTRGVSRATSLPVLNSKTHGLCSPANKLKGGVKKQQEDPRKKKSISPPPFLPVTMTASSLPSPVPYGLCMSPQMGSSPMGFPGAFPTFPHSFPSNFLSTSSMIPTSSVMPAVTGVSGTIFVAPPAGGPAKLALDLSRSPDQDTQDFTTHTSDLLLDPAAISNLNWMEDMSFSQH